MGNVMAIVKKNPKMFLIGGGAAAILGLYAAFSRSSSKAADEVSLAVSPEPLDTPAVAGGGGGGGASLDQIVGVLQAAFSAQNDALGAAFENQAGQIESLAAYKAPAAAQALAGNQSAALYQANPYAGLEAALPATDAMATLTPSALALVNNGFTIYQPPNDDRWTQQSSKNSIHSTIPDRGGVMETAGGFTTVISRSGGVTRYDVDDPAGMYTNARAAVSTVTGKQGSVESQLAGMSGSQKFETLKTAGMWK